jgi:hypothetical protein
MAMLTSKSLRVACAMTWFAAAAPVHAFDLQGHRGARGLMPENTLAGFAAALALGVTTLELDLGVTRDGVVVVSHDSLLNPDHTRGPDGAFLQTPGPPIRSLTLATLKRYDVGRLKPGTAYAATFSEQQAVDGATIPTLTEVFDLVRWRFNRSIGARLPSCIASRRRSNGSASPLTAEHRARFAAASRDPRLGRPGSTSTILAARRHGWWRRQDARPGLHSFAT